MKHYKLLLVVFFTIVITPASFAQLKPGDMAPNVKVIDADAMFPFNMGAAIVKKGAATGLIDMNGNFIIPYNKYKITQLAIGGEGRRATTGMFMTEKGPINAKGVLIAEAFPKLNWSVASDDGKILYSIDPKGGYIYMDAEGHMYPFKEPLNGIADGIGITQQNYKYGYRNLKGDWITKPIYSQAEPFSEGMAAVAKEDEFGQTKWGFIDRTGKEIIPLMYSFKPDGFRGGLARVQPKTTTDFFVAYIDKKGNIVQKFKQVVFYKYIGNGLYSAVYSDESHIMDSTGKVVTVKEFLQQLGITAQAADKSVNIGIENGAEDVACNDGKVSFIRIFKDKGRMNFGSVAIKTKVAIEGQFDHSGSFHYFDPVSKLACANFFLSNDYKDKTPPREGYVNEQGVFVIVKGEASKW